MSTGGEFLESGPILASGAIIGCRAFGVRESGPNVLFGTAAIGAPEFVSGPAFGSELLFLRGRDPCWGCAACLAVGGWPSAGDTAVRPFAGG